MIMGKSGYILSLYKEMPLRVDPGSRASDPPYAHLEPIFGSPNPRCHSASTGSGYT